MAKQKSIYVCQNCGTESIQWTGKCPGCNQWNTLVEERVVKTKGGSKRAESSSRVNNIKDVQQTEEHRIRLSDSELNRVLGGGLVPGSLILFGGEPGIGKSTLLLQMALKNKLSTLYVSGEESEKQIRMRADRIGIENDNCFLYTETSIHRITDQIKNNKPQVVVIDSIQTIYSETIESSPGSVSQIRESTSELLKTAKEHDIPVFLIGHITKEGNIAGPKVLEHMVDVVLQFEGDRSYVYRLLRCFKNRFGATSEIGIYEMRPGGLRIVENPSEMLLSLRNEHLSGIATAATLEGLRPMLIEIQALVSTAVYGTPQRSTTGFDSRRLNMLLAVLEKKCGFRLAMKDVFLNVTGGIKIEDPSVDLAVVAAVLSSNTDSPVPKDTVFAGEVGLSGEIRAVSKVELRISEAAKLGFSKIVISDYNDEVDASGIEVVRLKRIEELYTRFYAENSESMQHQD